MNKVETAFLVVKTEDGIYQTIPDIKTELELTREPNRLDVKHACSDLLDSIRRNDIVAQLLIELNKN